MPPGGAKLFLTCSPFSATYSPANSCNYMSKDRIVVGLLTSRELEMLGERFQRVEPDDLFADLLTQLDEFEATPVEEGVAIRRKQDG